MVALELEIVLHRAFDAARRARHRFVTPEHLLLQLLDRKAVVGRLDASAVRVASLRTALRDHLAKAPAFPPSDSEADTEPTLEFQKAVREAALLSRAGGRPEVTVLDMLSVLVDPRSGLSVSKFLRQAALPQSPGGPWCALCGSLTAPDSRTQVAERGVLCRACVDAVLAARRMRHDKETFP
jgi:ATP-dependent Clp protease ATP-binding subunit ClpA